MSILIANAFIGDGPFDGRTDGRTRTFNNHNFCANKRWVMVIRGSKWLCTIIEFLASLLTSPMEKLFNHSVSYFSHSYSFFPLFSLMIFFSSVLIKNVDWLHRSITWISNGNIQTVAKNMKLFFFQIEAPNLKET